MSAVLLILKVPIHDIYGVCYTLNNKQITGPIFYAKKQLNVIGVTNNDRILRAAHRTRMIITVVSAEFSNCHTTDGSLTALERVSGARIISLWPACLSDLTLRECYLWGNLKNKAYTVIPIWKKS
jgi:hypothetical protein